MSFYGDMADTATQLITEFGQTLRLVSRTPGVYVPAAGTASVNSVSYDVKGAIFNHPLKDVDGTLVKEGDKKVMLAVSSAPTPKPDDYICVGAACYTITSVAEIAPAGITVAYKLNAR